MRPRPFVGITLALAKSFLNERESVFVNRHIDQGQALVLITCDELGIGYVKVALSNETKEVDFTSIIFTKTDLNVFAYCITLVS